MNEPPYIEGSEDGLSLLLLKLAKQLRPFSLHYSVTTLSLAINTYGDDLPARVFFLRGSCYFSLGRLR